MAATISLVSSRSPFTPDPGYEKTAGYYKTTLDTSTSELDFSCRGRTRPEALDIATRHRQGIISRLLSTENINDTTSSSTGRRRKDKKRNHTSANRRRIREIQTKFKLRQREEEVPHPLPRPQTSTKYQYVQPKVSSFNHKSINKDTSLDTVQQIPRPSTTHTDQPHPPVISPAHLDKPHPPVASPSHTKVTRPFTVSGSSPNKPPSRLKRNFLLENITHASQAKIKLPPKEVTIKEEKEKKEKQITLHKKGVVPKYLIDRKEQWRIEEKERIASLPDPTIPEGHVLMPRQQKMETLTTLQEHYTELMTELQSLSLTADTLRVSNRRSQLESRLIEVEDAIKIFSKPKVFIKNNE